MKGKLNVAGVSRMLFLLLLATLNLQPSAVFAQVTAFTYQGRVTDNGTNFTGIGQFEFALVTSTNGQTATATAVMGGVSPSEFVSSCAVVNGGSGYIAPPAVSFSGGGGAGATATATVSGGKVAGITILTPGSGYSSAPTVTIAPPLPDFTTWWSNDGTSTNGSEPAVAVNVPVADGLFTVVLGDATQPGMTAIPASLFTQPNLQLRIWFNDGAQGFAVLDPAQNLTPAPYAVFATSASNLVASAQLNVIGLTIQNNTSGAPNVIGGSPVNYVSNSVYGATIAGGGAANVFGQSFTNSVTADFGTVGGGFGNTASGYDGTVGGGGGNNAGDDATVGGGRANTASQGFATVGGGYDNTAGGYYSTVGGGDDNAASGNEATVGGGILNVASGDYATVGGGFNNTASGSNATVAGGTGNLASGLSSFAAGNSAQALNDYSFVWSDGTRYSSTVSQQFAVHATGGAVFAADMQLSGGAAYHNFSLSGGNSIGFLYGSYPKWGDGIHLGYNYYADAFGNDHVPNAGGATSRLTAGYGFISLNVSLVTNSPPTTPRLLANSAGVTVYGTFNQSSDRNAKQDFAPINPSQILDEVLEIPVSEWSYKTDAGTRHIGPMAQDFYSIFNIGTDEKHIAPIDEGGVALAAIQGLSEKVKAQRAEIAVLKQRLEALEREMSARK